MVFSFVVDLETGTTSTLACQPVEAKSYMSTGIGREMTVVGVIKARG